MGRESCGIYTLSRTFPHLGRFLPFILTKYLRQTPLKSTNYRLFLLINYPSLTRNTVSYRKVLLWNDLSVVWRVGVTGFTVSINLINDTFTTNWLLEKFYILRENDRTCFRDMFVPGMDRETTWTSGTSSQNTLHTRVTYIQQSYTLTVSNVIFKIEIW